MNRFDQALEVSFSTEKVFGNQLEEHFEATLIFRLKFCQ